MSVRILVGDALAKLRELSDQSARCCVTSPPYYLLRDYGVEGQGGSEETPAHYIAWMVEVFAEVRRVLADDGTCWLNLGDSYATNGSRMSNKSMRDGVSAHQAVRGSAGTVTGYRDVPVGFKTKDLMLMPARVAIALCDDGWYVRSDIIWRKPNPMPESVTDRPTKSHEHVFLLSKSERYYYDADAIRESLAPASIERLAQPNLENQVGSDRVPGKKNGNMKAVARDPLGRDRRPSGWADSDDGARTGRYTSGNKERKPASARGVPIDTDGSPNGAVAGSVPWEDDGTGRNARDVWTIPTMPFKGAHFATFPPELPRRCISAGSAVGDTVLDPFGGAGTTGLVADRLGRHATLIELNPVYADMAERRIRGDNELFAEVSVS